MDVLASIRSNVRQQSKNSFSRTYSDQPPVKAVFLGKFHELPDDLIFKIFQFLDVSDLIQLTCIEPLRNLVEHFIFLNSTTKLLFTSSHNSSTTPSDLIKYRRLGILCSVCLHQSCFELQLYFLHRILSLHNCQLPINQCSSSHCYCLNLFGHFLLIFSRIHTPMLQEQLLNELQALKFHDDFSADERLKRIINSKPGQFVQDEVKWRNYTRALFLDCLLTPHNSFQVDKAPTIIDAEVTGRWVFRLRWLLGNLPVRHQAKLLFILFGPIYKDTLIWDLLTQNTAADFRQLKKCFGELGFIFSFLINSDIRYNFLCQTSRAKHHVVKIFDYMVSEPEDWLVENIACLLYASGSKFLTCFVLYKLSRNEYGDLVAILTSLCLLLVKIKQDIELLIRIIRIISNSLDSEKRVDFIEMLSKSFKFVIMDLYDNQDELDRRGNDFIFIVNAQTMFTRAILSELFEISPAARKRKFEMDPLSELINEDWSPPIRRIANLETDSTNDLYSFEE